ncbi:B-cell linker protein isoform X2 [Stegostoma tigrinum]|uniref:B-cell linker protein isoform X2 n=1 Tax=Stegostoma tigrinum TaxID=3053191 RepID=UPI00202B13D1|nr:B-cell linker protein isoform X2 [Stegostoma tigrinum]
MATKLPTREEFESWRPRELAEFLRLNNLSEPASVVERHKISGTMLLDSLDLLQNRFNVINYPQIQKIVHDIQKNDGGFMSRFKKFTKHAPPTVPQRDYSEGAGAQEGEQWSDNEFDTSDYENPDGRSDESDAYEDPRDDGDDDENYEPPPSENKNKKLVPQPMHISKGEYADNRPAASFAKPPPMLPRSSPVPAQRKITPHSQKIGEREDDEDDYIVPMENDECDDAYIDPTEKTAAAVILKPPMVNRAAKPNSKPSVLSSSPKAGHLRGPGQAASAGQLNTQSPQDHDVYEVPDTEEASPLVSRPKPQLPKPGSTGTGSPLLPPRSSPKVSGTTEIPRSEAPVNRKAPIPQPEDDNEEYEVCDPEPSNSSSNSQDSRTAPDFPVLSQRDLKPTNRPFPKPRMGDTPREQTEGEKPKIPDRPRLSNPTAEALVTPAPRLGPKPGVLRLQAANQSNFPEIPTRPNGTLGRPDVPARVSSPNSNMEQDPSVSGKIWFSDQCDRKGAEEALNKFNKDGCFLIRKSSGQDSKQPYTLVVFYRRRVYNIPVRYIELTKEYALGKEKNGEERFPSVAEIIESHQKNPLVLIDSQTNTKDSTKLKYPVKMS